MQLKITDMPMREWRALPGTAGSTASCSRVNRGLWLRELKLPVLHDGRLCFDAHKLYMLVKYFRVFEQLSAAADRPVLRGGILFAGAVPHWHFVMDGLATLPLDAVRETPRIYVDEELTAQQLELLRNWVAALAGVQPEICRIAAGCYELEDVLVPCTAKAASRVAALRSAVQRFGEACAWTDPSDPVVYFVSRRGAAVRRIVNEKEVLDRLSRVMEVRVVQPETLGLEAQMAMFRNARGVIGGHGSGLTNAVFSRSLEFVAELAWVREYFYGALSEACGCPLISVAGEPWGSAGARSIERDFYMDSDEVVARLREFA